jgi:hypothetical protein
LDNLFESGHLEDQEEDGSITINISYKNKMQLWEVDRLASFGILV